MAFTLLVECKTALEQSERVTTDESVKEKKESKKTDAWYELNVKGLTDKTYAKNIKTCLLYKTGLELNEPVILLNGNETVTLKFDDLDGYLKDYSYSIIHCNKNWEESGLTETEYLQGFLINPVSDYKISFNTLQKYIHYSVSLPNENLKILRSGNYVIRVFPTNDPENIILSRRFMVYEGRCEIKPTVKRPSDLNERYFKQEIDFSVFPSGIATNNTFDIIIRQNSRWDNQIGGLQPVFYRDNELVYDLDQPNIFNGANEFRFFDIRSTSYTSERVLKIARTDSIFEAILIEDQSRGFKKYLTYQDINGKFKIENQQSPEDEHHSEADYIWVNFTFKSPATFEDGTLYIFGGLTDWDFQPDFRMQYNDSLKCYQKKVLLKQGYYNYEYVLLKDNQNAAVETELEGNHFDTENFYSIFVYFRDITDNYDRLIGYKPFSSINF